MYFISHNLVSYLLAAEFKSNYRLLVFVVLALLPGFMVACGQPSIPPTEEVAATPIVADVPITPTTELIIEGSEFKVKSTAFELGSEIPVRFTCDGEDTSLPVMWSGGPQTAQSYVLIMEDPDAPGGTWIHWILYNLPPELGALEAGAGSDQDLPAGTLVGKNDWGDTSYGGPCPPGGTHRYFIYLFALDTRLDLGTGATKDILVDAMNGHILAQSDWMGTYTR